MDLAGIENDLRQAIGRRSEIEDVVAPALVARLAVTLEADPSTVRSGANLPIGWHTAFCVDAPARSELGVDGLPNGIRLIPQVDMQRRMFGGARLTFHAALKVGEAIRCESELADVKVRTTATGHLAIATLRHRFYGPGGLAVVEEQDIIHLQPLDTAIAADKAPAPVPAAASPPLRPAPTWQRTIVPDTVMLFRFSAVTFNSHRIHYDAPYASQAEKLPGLIVQGKLLALQLLETMRRNAPGAAISHFEYRSTRPLYAGAPCTLAVEMDHAGSAANLWAENDTGAIVQTASLKLVFDT